MPGQRLLDLGGVDVEAAGDVHVLEPVGDPQVARLVEHADVAGVQPAVRVDRLGGRRGVVEVAEHHVVAADQQLAASSASIRVSMPGIARPQVVATSLGGVALPAHRHDDRLGHPERGHDLVDAEPTGSARIRSISTTGTTAAPVTASRSEDRSWSARPGASSSDGRSSAPREARVIRSPSISRIVASTSNVATG